MNAKLKKRMVAVGGIIAIVVIVLLAVLGAGSSATVATVAQVANGELADAKVQVTGVVVDNSYSVDETGTLVFSIADEADTARTTTLKVSYDKGVSATFGNGVSAICTGRLDEDGTLVCSELVTKCPSKYENATNALSVSALLSYDTEKVLNKNVKVAGVVSRLADATSAVRFVLLDEEGAAGVAAGANASAGAAAATGAATADTDTAAARSLSVAYAGALPDDVADGAVVVATGALQEDGSFLATDVSLEA